MENYITRLFYEETQKFNYDTNCVSLSKDLGCVLFNLNYGLINNNEIIKDKSLDAFEAIYSNSLNIINQNSLSFLDGFAGVMWVYLNLIKIGLYDLEEDFSTIDSLFLDKIKEEKQKGNYDLFYGILGYGLYFIERGSLDKNCQKYLNLIVDILEEISLNDKKGIYWVDTLAKKKVVNLGMAHGIPCIISFLCKVYEITFYEKALELAHKSINWLVDKKCNFENYSLYPQAIDLRYLSRKEDFDYNSRLAWCYGDLAVAVAISKFNKIYPQSSITTHIDELIYALSFRNMNEGNSGVKDMGICHGVAGIYYLYTKLESLTTNSNVKLSKEYWKDYLLQGDKIQDYYTLTYSDSKEHLSNDVGILCGYSGIGLTILGIKNDKYNYWEKAFML